LENYLDGNEFALSNQGLEGLLQGMRTVRWDMPEAGDGPFPEREPGRLSFPGIQQQGMLRLRAMRDHLPGSGD